LCWRTPDAGVECTSGVPASDIDRDVEAGGQAIGDVPVTVAGHRRIPSRNTMSVQWTEAAIMGAGAVHAAGVKTTVGPRQPAGWRPRTGRIILISASEHARATAAASRAQQPPSAGGP
jgi:hypothetical protein